MKGLGISLVSLAGLVFWLCFFKLAPLVTGALPPSEWSGILEIIIYILVGYLGGIGIPLALCFIGIGAFVQGLD